MKNIELNTQRFILRKIESGDVDDLFSIYSDEIVMKYWNSKPFEARFEMIEMVDNAIKCWGDGSSACFAIVDSITSRVIGTVSLFNFHAESRRAEIGYILSRNKWQKGVMTEVLRAIISFAFNTLELNRFEADIDPDNEASEALLKKLGFVLEGRLRQRWIVDGKISDSHIYGLLARK